MNFRRIMVWEIHFDLDSNNPVMKSLTDRYLESEEFTEQTVFPPMRGMVWNKANRANNCAVRVFCLSRNGFAGAFVGRVATVSFPKPQIHGRKWPIIGCQPFFKILGFNWE
jgi:hypothetical protein